MNIELGYYLVNTETSKRNFFYASENTAFYDLVENPMINTCVDLVLNDIPNLETIIENIKSCILWITLDNNSERMYKVAWLVGQ